MGRGATGAAYDREEREGIRLGLSAFLYLPNNKEVKFQPIFYCGYFFDLLYP
jgi:hypothetical protein